MLPRKFRGKSALLCECQESRGKEEASAWCPCERKWGWKARAWTVIGKKPRFLPPLGDGNKTRSYRRLPEFTLFFLGGGGIYIYIYIVPGARQGLLVAWYRGLPHNDVLTVQLFYLSKKKKRPQKNCLCFIPICVIRLRTRKQYSPTRTIARLNIEHASPTHLLFVALAWNIYPTQHVHFINNMKYFKSFVLPRWHITFLTQATRRNFLAW